MNACDLLYQKQVNCMTDNLNCLIKSRDFILTNYITVYTNVLFGEILGCLVYNKASSNISTMLQNIHPPIFYTLLWSAGAKLIHILNIYKEHIYTMHRIKIPVNNKDTEQLQGQQDS